MDFPEVIRSRRSIRRFKNKPIGRHTVYELLEVGRYAPSAANRQPLEFVIVDDRDVAEKIFEQLAWGTYVRPNRNPAAGNRPVAYIVVLVNHSISEARFCTADAAAAIENMLLAAWSKGIGSCWLGSVQRENVKKILSIPEGLEIDSIIALGYPDETPVTEDAEGDSIKYYLDENDRLHVPKRKLADIAHLNKY